DIAADARNKLEPVTTANDSNRRKQRHRVAVLVAATTQAHAAHLCDPVLVMAKTNAHLGPIVRPHHGDTEGQRPRSPIVCCRRPPGSHQQGRCLVQRSPAHLVDLGGRGEQVRGRRGGDGREVVDHLRPAGLVVAGPGQPRSEDDAQSGLLPDLPDGGRGKRFAERRPAFGTLQSPRGRCTRTTSFVAPAGRQTTAPAARMGIRKWVMSTALPGSDQRCVEGASMLGTTVLYHVYLME
ncbi:hypothetical protein BC793_13881, partial [Actinoplanes xinjiangensis]